MIEPIKDVADFLGINPKATTTSIVNINSIVGVHIPVKKKKEKKKDVPNYYFEELEAAVDRAMAGNQATERRRGNRPAPAPRLQVVQARPMPRGIWGEGPNQPQEDRVLDRPGIANEDNTFRVQWVDPWGRPRGGIREELQQPQPVAPEPERDNPWLQYKSDFLESLLKEKVQRHQQLSAVRDGIHAIMSSNDAIRQIEEAIQILKKEELKPLPEPESKSKVELVQDYFNQTLHWPAIIKGIIINNTTLITDPTYNYTSSERNDLKYSKFQYLLKVATIEDGKVKYKFHRTNNIKGIGTSIFVKLLPVFLKIKLRSADNSIEVFGSESAKSELIGQYLDNYQIYASRSKKLGTDSYILEANIANKKLKFVLQDLEVINPNLKGYNIPKITEFTIATKVGIKDTDVVGNIISIKSNISSKRMKNNNLRRLDVVTIRTTKGTISSTYANKLKLLENVKEAKLPF